VAPAQTIDRLEREWPTASTPVAASPRIIWVLLAASAAAILLVGAFATMLVLGNYAGGAWRPAGVSFAWRFALGCTLTVVSLAIRSLRWIFLLRRAGTRIPIRDAYVGYFAGLSLLLTPFLLGEIAVRAALLKARARVPVATTVVVNLWDRLLDLIALAIIAGGVGLLLDVPLGWSAVLLAAGGVTLLPFVRRSFLRAATAVAAPVARRIDRHEIGDVSKLAGTRTWLAATGASVAAWSVPGLALWAVAGTWEHSMSLLRAEHAYAWSAGLGGLVLAPGGVIVTGRSLLETLGAAGLPAAHTAIIVFGIRLATAGVATALGTVFLFVHLRSRSHDASHFDAIAAIYDDQLPESRRRALLAKKTALMQAVLDEAGIGHVGLDVGCGQGEHLARMRDLGFAVRGIDNAPAQIERAVRKLGSPDLVRVGSVLAIPAPDTSFDFAYTINVLHHLESLDDQRHAVAELLRVLKPGGLLLVHEINTRSILFRFYMGYVYPSLNSIDEGVERWLLPHRFDLYTNAPVAQVRYFTFLPEFLPSALVQLLAPIERLLEASPLRVYSAHYLAVLRKPGATNEAASTPA
jgi:ubiquinone/menaquinone biosynthesis C-methylase UbiE